MPQSSPPAEEGTRPEDSQIVWYSELLIALDRGDFGRASEAQAELARLGWIVSRRKPKRPGKTAPGRGGGR